MASNPEEDRRIRGRLVEIARMPIEEGLKRRMKDYCLMIIDELNDNLSEERMDILDREVVINILEKNELSEEFKDNLEILKENAFNTNTRDDMKSFIVSIGTFLNP